MVWIRVSGIPCHACGLKLFKLVSESLGSFIRCDDQTLARLRMDTSRLLIKRNHQPWINVALNVAIDGTSFKLFLTEDHQEQKVIVASNSDGEEEEDESKAFSSPAESTLDGEEEGEEETVLD